MTQLPTIRALLLAEDESSLALDRKVLRRIGVAQTQFFALGSGALEYLLTFAPTAHAATGPDMTSGNAVCATQPPPVDMIICAERLADMTGLRFLSHVRASAETAHIPALFLTSSAESTVALAARATNSCSVLARPYTQDQAETALSLACRPQYQRAPLVLPPSFADRYAQPRADAGSAPRSLREPLSRPSPRNRGEAALREGLAALVRGDTATADKLLHGSFRVDPDRIETCLGLSRLYAFLHKEREELQWLCKAGVLCLKRGDPGRAATIFSRLPRGKMGQEPLLIEAGLVLQEGETKAAALSFLEAYRLDPSRPLHTLIGRTCMFTPAPEEHMNELVKALSTAGHDATAGKLYTQLLQPPKEEGGEESGFLANFPFLSDIISVAAHTFKAWRHAA